MIDRYEPDIVTAQDYYPFGMMSRVALPNNEVPYKFGFNGKMNDNEVKGGFGLQQDYGMRIYDSRVGRFLSVDPITRQYPELTPYQFASNSPIFNIDIDGLEGTSWWYRFLTDPANTLMTGTTWDDINAAAGDINNATGAGAVINGGFQAATGRDPVTLQSGASRIDGFGQAVIGGIFHASAVHLSTPPVNSAAALEKQIAKNAVATTNKAAAGAHESISANEQTPNVNVGKASYAGDTRATFVRKNNNRFLNWGSETLDDAIRTEPIIANTNPVNVIRTEMLQGNADARVVGGLMKLIRQNVTLDAIEVASINNKLYIINGHHRVEAAIRTASNIQYRILTKQQWQAYGYKSEQDIINAANEANLRRIKLDNKVIQKAASTD